MLPGETLVMAAQLPYLVGHTEIAALFGIERQTSQKWRTDGILGEPDLIASGNPYWLLHTVLQLDGHSGREITERRLAQYKATIPGGYSFTDSKELPALAGIKEAALVLRVDERAIARWRNRRTIADEDLKLSGSPLWLLDTLIADAQARGRAVDAEAHARLLAGERLSQKPRGRKAALGR